MVFLNVGCEESEITKPEKLIPEDQYIDLLAEMQLIRVWYSSLGDSIDVDSLKNEVFNEYNISEEQFMTSHTYYDQFITAQKERVNKTIERLEAELKKIEDQDVSSGPDSVSAPADSTEQ